MSVLVVVFMLRQGKEKGTKQQKKTKKNVPGSHLVGTSDGSRAGLDRFAHYGLEVLLELGIFNSEIRFDYEFRNETLASPDLLGTSSDQEAQGPLNALL